MEAPDTTRFQLIVHYDGSAFRGWQFQPDQRTVQGDLQAALSTLADAPTTVIGSGRTDTGVHATGQVASVDMPARWTTAKLRKAMNATLPREIWVESVRRAALDFHPRYDAVARRYTYRVGLDEHAQSPFQRSQCWALGEALDRERLASAAERLLGRHSFEAFAKAGQPERGYECVVAAAVWTDWERTGHPVAMPGAVEALARLRAAGITPVVNTNRSSASAAQTAAALEAAGLGHFVHGDTLLLQGDDDAGSGKDKRRATIAARYCVVAMAGDNLGDFSDQFNAKDVPVAQRRDLAAAQGIEGSVSALWGRGWFLMPNPVYGPSIAGDIDTIFPPEWRWMPTQGEQ